MKPEKKPLFVQIYNNYEKYFGNDFEKVSMAYKLWMQSYQSTTINGREDLFRAHFAACASLADKCYRDYDDDLMCAFEAATFAAADYQQVKHYENTVLAVVKGVTMRWNALLNSWSS